MKRIIGMSYFTADLLDSLVSNSNPLMFPDLVKILMDAPFNTVADTPRYQPLLWE